MKLGHKILIGLGVVFVTLLAVVSCQPQPQDQIVSRERVGEPRQVVTTEECFEEWEYKKKYKDEPVYTIQKVKKQEKVYKWDNVTTKSCKTVKGKRECSLNTKKVKKFVGYKTKWVEEKVKTGTKKVAYQERVADYGVQEVTKSIFDVKTTYQSGKVIMSQDEEITDKTECD